MRNTVEFTIDGLPVSVNNGIRYNVRTKRSYKTKAYREWEKLVEKQPVKTINKSEWYGVEVVFHFPLYFKNGNIRNKDADDLIKYAIDCVLKRVTDSDRNSIDDKRILEGSFAKIDSEELKTEVCFYTIE